MPILVGESEITLNKERVKGGFHRSLITSKINKKIREAIWLDGDTDKYEISESIVGQKVIQNEFQEYADKAHIYKNFFNKIKEHLILNI